MSSTEFRMVCESGDIDTYDTYDEAFAAMESAVRRDIAERGEEDARASGVMHPYGYSIQVVHDGEDVTQDWLIHELSKPIDMA